MGIFFWFLRPKSKLSAVTLRQIFEVFSVQALSKSSWRIILIVASKNEAVCCWVQTNLEVFALFALTPYEVYEESSWRIIMICASKNEAVCCEVQTHFGSFRLAIFVKKSSGCIFTICASKMKLFTVKFRRMSKVLCLRLLQKKFWAQFHDLCVQKGSCLLWNSDAFWKFFACKIYRKSSGQIFTIYVSKNEAVCCEVQTHSACKIDKKVVKFVPNFFCKFWNFFKWILSEKIGLKRLCRVLFISGYCFPSGRCCCFLK